MKRRRHLSEITDEDVRAGEEIRRKAEARPDAEPASGPSPHFSDFQLEPYEPDDD